MLSDGGTNILLDAGISMRRVEKSLSLSGLSVQDINGVLITHEHSDHISGLKMLLKHYNLPVYAPRTVGNRLRGMLPEIEDRLITIPVGEYFTLQNLRIFAFHTSHDTDESVGYRIEGNGIFSLATDTGCINDEIRSALSGSDAALIESNHDERLLCDGPYPFYLKRRILSDRGHLSNTCCSLLARYLAENGTKKIILGHLSCTNNLPELAMKENEASLTGMDCALFCAPKLGNLEIDIGVGI